MTDTAEIASALWGEAGGDDLLAATPNGFPTNGDGVPFEELLYTLDGRTLLSHIAETAEQKGTDILPFFGLLCGLLLLSSCLRKFRVSERGENSLPTHLLTLFFLLTVLTRLTDLLYRATVYFGSVHNQMTTALTTMTTLAAMRGMATTATVSGIGMAFFLSVCETVTVGILPTFLRLCAGLSLASFLGGDVCALPMELSGVVRRQFLWITGAVMTVLTAVLSYQTVLARSADSVSMRAVRFTLAGAIPVVGGAVGEAMSAVTAGFSLVSGTVGVIGIACILWQILPPLCTVLLTRYVFSFAGTVAKTLACDDEERILSECASIAGFLAAVMAAEGVLYILMLTLCMKGFT